MEILTTKHFMLKGFELGATLPEPNGSIGRREIKVSLKPCQNINSDGLMMTMMMMMCWCGSRK